MNELITSFVAMLPIIELRGAIPIGVAKGLTVQSAFLFSVIGNMLPVPFLILFTRKIFSIIRTKNKKINEFVVKLEQKAESKYYIIEKYEAFGLFLLVAIPLPGTGAWTGSLVAALLNMRIKTAIIPIFLGVITAGIIVSYTTYGITALLF